MIYGIKILEGKTITSVKREDERVIFRLSDGSEYAMQHYQDCCESVNLDDVTGDLDDLIGSPVLVAEERSNSDQIGGEPNWAESFTWTFYHIATAKGRVDFRWLGTSNGYYSEDVDFAIIKGPNE